MAAETDVGVASAALALARRGWPVFPTRGKVPRTACGLKDATVNERAIVNWFKLWPDSGIAVRTGSGLVVLDVDGCAGADALHGLERQHGALPGTVSVVTGGGGAHYYFRATVPVRNSAGRLGRGLDIRGDGGYVVAPPSLHPSGRRYEFENHPDDVELAMIPQWIVSSVADASATAGPRRESTATWVAMVRNGLPSGERNSGLTRIVGHLLAKDVDARLVLELAHLINGRCRPPLPAGEVDRLVQSICGCELRKRRAP
jgi:hypothetical protein